MYKKIFGILIVGLFIGTIFSSMLFIKNVNAERNNGLIAYWSFNDQNDVGYDNSDNGHDAVNYGATWISNGILGGALSFDGLNDYVQITDTTDFLFKNEDITCSAWVQIRDNADFYYPFVSLNDYLDNSPAYLLMKGRKGNANGAIYTKIRNEDSIDTSSYSLLDGDELPKNTWLFITSVVDYKNTNTLKLYINGILQSTSNLVDFDFGISDNLYMIIGARAGIYGTPMEEYHNGLIDDVRIYNRVLSQEEIIFLFEEPYKPSFLIGKIDNLNSISNYIIIFEAEKLWVIEFSPFQYFQYSKNEKINVLDNYFGIIADKLIIGFFKTHI
jgi:hypothetical protein